MRSTVKGSNYVVCMEDNRYPEKLPVKKTDTQLNKLYSLLNAVAELGDKIAKESPALRDMLNESVLYGNMELDYDGRIGTIDCILYNLKKLQETLKENRDDISLKKEDWMTIEDLGFSTVMFTRGHVMYEKSIESSDIRDVVEEIQCYGEDKILYRKRTTYWKVSPGCKESTNIEYKRLRLTPKLKKIILRSAETYIKKG